MGELSVYASEGDWVVAWSEADANAVADEHVGEDAGERSAGWLRVPDETVLVVNDEDEGRLEKSAREWADSNGRGFLASVNW